MSNAAVGTQQGQAADGPAAISPRRTGFRNGALPSPTPVLCDKKSKMEVKLLSWDLLHSSCVTLGLNFLKLCPYL